jgi:hypothetical protein
VQRLFGVGLRTRFTCAESGEAEGEDATVFELKCNITSDVNLLSEGLRLGLVSDREKNSAALGRLALFQARAPAPGSVGPFFACMHARSGMLCLGMWLPLLSTRTSSAFAG